MTDGSEAKSSIQLVGYPDRSEGLVLAWGIKVGGWAADAEGHVIFTPEEASDPLFFDVSVVALAFRIEDWLSHRE